MPGMCRQLNRVNSGIVDTGKAVYHLIATLRNHPPVRKNTLPLHDLANPACGISSGTLMAVLRVPQLFSTAYLDGEQPQFMGLFYANGFRVQSKTRNLQNERSLRNYLFFPIMQSKNSRQ